MYVFHTGMKHEVVECMALDQPFAGEPRPEGQDAPLPPDKAALYASIAAKALYLSADRPDIQFAAKKICRWMSSPAAHGIVALKRLGRHLEQHARLLCRYP